MLQGKAGDGLMDSKKNRKVVMNLVTAGILLVLVFLVFRKDYRAILSCIRQVSVPGLLLILGMDMGYQFMESLAHLTLVRTKLPSFRLRQAIEIVFLGVFGNVSTFSVGIIPMQSYYLYQCGVPVGSGVGITILEYVFHKITVFLYAMIMMLVYGEWLGAAFPEYIKYIYLGFAVCALIITVLILICTWGVFQRIVLQVIEKLPNTGKWKEKKSVWREDLESLYRESRNVLRNRRCCLRLVILNFMKLSCLYVIPFFCIRILGFPGITFVEAHTLAAVMILLAGVLPNVAGIGPTEAAFLFLFSACVDRVSASAALILYRIATYFFPFLISIFVFFKAEKRVTDTAAERMG